MGIYIYILYDNTFTTLWNLATTTEPGMLLVVVAANSSATRLSIGAPSPPPPPPAAYRLGFAFSASLRLPQNIRRLRCCAGPLDSPVCHPLPPAPPTLQSLKWGDNGDIYAFDSPRFFFFFLDGTASSPISAMAAAQSRGRCSREFACVSP